MANLAIASEVSKNSKTGEVSATYTGYQTCPDSCEFKPVLSETGEFQTAPCYASCDLVGMHMHRLTRNSVGIDLVQIAAAESAGIKKLTGKKVLRLKVGGDFPTPQYAETIAAAAAGYTAKHSQPAYSYTHNWEAIDRSAFGTISVLASCDKPEDLAAAKARGYATAIVVSEFPNGAKLFNVLDNKCVPCPNQINKAVQCVDCKLCFDDAKLRNRNLTIGFIPHGRKADELEALQASKGL